jgi:aminoglycoside 3-N-acetyltransferase I
MPPVIRFDILRLGGADVAPMRAMLQVFGEAFGEVPTYTAAQPRSAYLERLLGSAAFIALAATKHGVMVGGLAAYELVKFEQERSEIYIYDLNIGVYLAHFIKPVGFFVFVGRNPKFLDPVSITG